MAKGRRKEVSKRTIPSQFRCFHKSELLFSCHDRRMIAEYPEQWVAVYNGEVKAHNSDYNIVLSQIDEDKIPRALTLIRYVTKNQSSMVL